MEHTATKMHSHTHRHTNTHVHSLLTSWVKCLLSNRASSFLFFSIPCQDALSILSHLNQTMPVKQHKGGGSVWASHPRWEKKRPDPVRSESKPWNKCQPGYSERFHVLDSSTPHSRLLLTASATSVKPSESAPSLILLYCYSPELMAFIHIITLGPIRPSKSNLNT